MKPEEIIDLIQQRLDTLQISKSAHIMVMNILTSLKAELREAEEKEEKID